MLSRAARKRVSRMSEQAQKELARTTGQELSQVATRLDLAMFLEALTILGNPDLSALEMARRLVAALHEHTLRGEQVACTEFLDGDHLRQVACGGGCNWCCHQSVMSSIPDAVSVALHLDGRAPAGLAAYNRSILETTGRRRAAVGADYGRCPFLAEEGQCGVYPARPAVCRAVHSTSVEECAEQVRQRAPNRKVPSYTVLYGLQGMAQEALNRALFELAIDNRPVLLGPAVELILTDPDRVIADWLSGAPVFEPVGVLE